MASTEGISERRKTVLAAIKSYNDWSLPDMLSYRSENCIHEILPKSLKQPPLNNTEYAAYFKSIMPFFTNFTVHVNQIVEDEKENKVIVWAKSTATTPLGDYANEYMLGLWFDGEGKVERFLEFVDSRWSAEFFVKLANFGKELAEKKAEAEVKATV